jgi:hypothetical protein
MKRTMDIVRKRLGKDEKNKWSYKL